jgi:hypothetical protein
VVVKELALFLLFLWSRDQAAKGKAGTTPAKPSPVPWKMSGAGPKLTKADLVSLAKAAGFPDPNLAAAIAMAESGGDPRAVNSTAAEYSVGLWQINLKAHPLYNENDLKDPARNAEAARDISNFGANWKPWGAYTNGSYKQFL